MEFEEYTKVLSPSTGDPPTAPISNNNVAT